MTLVDQYSGKLQRRELHQNERVRSVRIATRFPLREKSLQLHADRRL